LFDEALKTPLRFFFAAAVLAAILCLYPARVEELESAPIAAQQETAQTAENRSVHADLSERTGAACHLHTTLHYAPCGHSVQRRERLPAQLSGLSRAALEAALPGVIPGAAVTGFSQDEVDIAVNTDIPCPLHWVLRAGEDGMLHVLQNRDGETLSCVRVTDVSAERLEDDAQIHEGMIFDDVQALEGYLESISS